MIRLGSDVDGEHIQGLIGADMIEHVAVGLLGTYYSDIVEANMGLGMFHPRAACRVKGSPTRDHGRAASCSLLVASC